MWKGNFLFYCQKSSLGSFFLYCKGTRITHWSWCESNFVSTTPWFQTQSVAFVRLCSAARYDKQGNNWNLLGCWVDFTVLLWFTVITVKMGALEGVCDVFVLFHAGLGSPLHALMSWCGFWCWPSNLLWRSGPGVHPSILPLSHSQSTLCTHIQHHIHRETLTHLHHQQKNAPPRSPAPSCRW